MSYQNTEHDAAGGGLASATTASYAPGRPEDKNDGRWRHKLAARAEALKYLRSAERYWYGESFGSEKRRGAA